MFDGPLNEEQPERAPTRPMGRVPVIVRFVWADREEFVPARANRWTGGHVLVIWSPDENSGVGEQMVWLRACDVHRRLTSPPPWVRDAER